MKFWDQVSMLSDKAILGLYSKCFLSIKVLYKGSGGGQQLVSVLASYSDNPSSNASEAYSCFCKICGWKERK